MDGGRNVHRLGGGARYHLATFHHLSGGVEAVVLNPIVSTQGGSAVNITTHPLVALFSAGPCTAGHSIRVRFHANGSQTSRVTNSVACSQKSANFLVAGMTQNTEYEMHWEEYATGFLKAVPTWHSPPVTSRQIPARDLPGKSASDHMMLLSAGAVPITPAVGQPFDR